MIIATSALVAIVLTEASAPAPLLAIESDPIRLISSTVLVEASIVLGRGRTTGAVEALDGLLSRIGSSVVPFDEAQARIARDAYRDYGKGSGHPAQLNFGDCFSYALAKVTGEQLLCTGSDFPATGIPVVAWQ